METLDLHGLRHHLVEIEVENFILLNETPVRIITGNSPAMKQIVESVLDKYELQSEVESYWNLGAVIVTDATK